MAIPISKLTKPLVEGTPQEVFEQVSKKTSEARQKTGFELQKTKAKLQEEQAQKSLFGEASEREELLREKKRDLYLKALRLKKEDELKTMIYENQKKGITARDTIKDILSAETGVGKAHSNIEGRTYAIETRINSKMHDVREKLRTRWAGLVQDKEMGYELIRYLKDGVVKNKQLEQTVKQLGDQWKESSEMLRSLRNKAGGKIGKIEDWVVPQSHDKSKLLKSGKQEWIKAIAPKLDRARIEKEQGAVLEDVLDSAYDNITKRVIEKAPMVKGQNLAKRNEFERVLHFKDGESMIKYNQEFGNPDVFATMDSHVRSQSNEIAQLQILGPNPELTYESLKVLARNEKMGKTKENLLDALYNVSTGKVDVDSSVDKLDAFVAQAGGTYRAIQIGSKLGSASISAIADISNILIGGGYRNINGVKIFGRGLATLLQEAFSGKGIAKNTEIASRLGLISEFANASLTNTRYAEQGTGWFQRRAENVIRGSGLAAWTNAQRVAFSLEVAASFAENFGKQFDQVPFKRMLEEYGITKADWDLVRTSKTKKIQKANFIDMDEIYKIDEELGYKVSSMINEEVNAFVVAPGYRARVFTTWGAEKGTLKGEAARNIMLFKSFPVTVTMMHLNRMGTMTTGGKVAYASGSIVAGAVFGTIALWAHDIATNKTPRDLERWQMLPESILKSGGLGIFGDMFLGEEKTRYGHSWTGQLIGVPQSTIEDLGMSLADSYLTVTGEKSPDKYIANMYNRASNYIPGQNLWYTRLVMQQSIGKAIGEMIDPDYHKKIRKRKKALRLRGQEYIFE